MRWLAFLLWATAVGLAIRWGLRAWEPIDFYRLHDWVGFGLTLSIACLVGGALWAYYTCFPSLLHASRLVSNVLAAVIFVATSAAVVYLGLGINRMGPRPGPQQVIGKLTRYTAARRASNASRAGHYGVVELENGLSLEVPLGVIDQMRLKIGDRLPVLLHRGRLFDWGWLEPPRARD